MVRHLKRIPNHFSVFLPILTRRGPKRSTPQEYKTGLQSQRHTEGRSAILGIVGWPSNVSILDSHAETAGQLCSLVGSSSISLFLQTIVPIQNDVTGGHNGE